MNLVVYVLATQCPIPPITYEVYHMRPIVCGSAARNRIALYAAPQEVLHQLLP